MKLNSLVVNGLAVGALAAPANTDNHIIHERRDVSPHSQWTKGAALDINAMIPVRIALKQRNLENGMDYIMKVYVLVPSSTPFYKGE
jgi:tripeptidyl-peptidase-1